MGRLKLQMGTRSVRPWLDVLKHYGYTHNPNLKETTHNFLEYEGWEQMQQRSVNAEVLLTDRTLGLPTVLTTVGAGQMVSMARPLQRTSLMALPAVLSPFSPVALSGIAIASLVSGVDWKRLDRAKEYRSEAADYKRKVMAHVAAMEQSCATLVLIEAKVAETTRLLLTLEDALQKRMTPLRQRLSSTLSPAEEALLQAGYHIVTAIHTVISTPILTAQGFPNEQTSALYARIYQMIRQMG